MAAPNGDTFAPLLFTPRPATGQARSDYASPRYGGRHGGLERSPAADRGGVPSFSRLGSSALRDGATPRGRGGTPGPPGGGGPSLAGAPSLFESSYESPSGGGGGGGWGAPAPPTASLMAVDGGGGLAGTLGGSKAAAPVGGGGDGDAWVTAFGFAPRDAPLALDALAACGDVLAFGSGRHDAVNWVHVQFAVSERVWVGKRRVFFFRPRSVSHRPFHPPSLSQNKHQAARALARDGSLLAGRVILGVRPLDAAHRAEAATVATGGGGAASTPSAGALRSAPPSMPTRAYRVDAPASDGLPAPAGGPWSKVARFVFGA